VGFVYSPSELLGKVRDVAKKIASKGPLAVAQCKRAILRGADVPLATAMAASNNRPITLRPEHFTGSLLTPTPS